MCLCVLSFCAFSNGLSSLGDWAIERLRPWHVILAHPFTKDPPHRCFLAVPPLRYDVLVCCCSIRIVRRWHHPLSNDFDVFPILNKVSRVGSVSGACCCCFPMSYYFFVPFCSDTTLVPMIYGEAIALAAGSLQLLLVAVLVACGCCCWVAVLRCRVVIEIPDDILGPWNINK